MEPIRFDRVTGTISLALSRRRLASTLGLATIGLPGSVAAKKKRKKKKVTFNDFGCVDVGKFCKNGGQCCSGICQGKKGKKKCRAHDAEGCIAGQQEPVCGGTNIECTTSAGEEGVCDTTTGNAGYCTSDGGCFACRKDADCQEVCGPAAACMLCADECADFGGTACVGPDACQFPPD